MKGLITIISYYSLLLMIMPASLSGIVQTLLLVISGTSLIAWKKPYSSSGLLSWQSITSAAILAATLGVRFYNCWSYSSKVAYIASVLGTTVPVILTMVSLALCLLSIFFITGILHQFKDFLRVFGQKNLLARDILLCIFFATVTVILSQTMIDVKSLSMGTARFLWGILLTALPILIIYCLCGNIKLSVLAGTLPMILICTINVYVYQFRGRMFDPMDIAAAQTALKVTDNYSFFPIPLTIVTSLGMWISLMSLLPGPLFKRIAFHRPVARRFLALICMLCIVCATLYTSKLRPYYWDKEGAVFNGYLLDFFAKIHHSKVSAPDGYSAEKITELSNQYIPEPQPAQPEEKIPHIIVIMDEAFSDLSVHGPIETNIQVTPFISSMDTDVITGHALCSVYGGNTANSEFEFLTGNSMAFLPSNSVPYQQYIQAPTYSMVSYLKSEYDYQCIAMHPYSSIGWDRPDVYTHLGFDQFLFIESFPQKDFVRQYISDREMFEKVVDIFSQRSEQPLFIWGVSMQNHGGYTYSGENSVNTIQLVGYEEQYPEAEQYLSLLHETDKAVEYLITYFENIQEPVVIVFFGDHQPKMDSLPVSGWPTDANASLDEQQKRYIVPFFIWANYDIPERNIECTSLNYLSSYVYEAAGLRVPPYCEFLTDLEAVIPAMNAYGFYSQTLQHFVPFDEATEQQQQWLDTYSCLQYNALFDADHKSHVFFPIIETLSVE